MSNLIDNLFKKALDNQKCEPPAHIWQNVEKQLGKRRRVVGIWWLRGAAAITLLAALTGLWQLKQPDPIRKMAGTVKQNVYIPSADRRAPEKTEVKIVALPPVRVVETEFPIEKVRSIPGDKPIPMDILKSAESVSLANSTPAPRLNINTVRRNIIPLTSKEALKNNLQYLALLENHVQEERIKERVNIALSGHVVPAYSSGNYSSSVKNTRGFSYSDQQMEGLVSTGGGLRLSVSKGKRLSLQTGIFYSRMGQTTTEDNTGAQVASFALAGTERRVATPLGNVKAKRKAIAYRSSDATVLNSIANTDEAFEQVFGTVEIPLYLRYKLNDNKVLFSLSGGFSGNFIVDNKIYLKSGNDKELLGSTEDIRNFNMSTDWGLGIEYPINRRIKIMIEPGFKYYLQSLSRNDEINFKPYMFTLSTGIGFEF